MMVSGFTPATRSFLLIVVSTLENRGSERGAMFWNRRPTPGLWVMSWPGREARLLAAELVPDGWSPDGRWIYAHRQGTRTIVRVALDAGQVETVGEFPGGVLPLSGCDVKRDGRAIICGLLETTSDAWLLRNLEPAPPGAQ